MNLNAVIDLWIQMGVRTFGLSFLQTPVETIRREALFPPGLPREQFFQSLPASGGKDFFVQDEGGKLARVRLAVMIEEVKT